MKKIILLLCVIVPAALAAQNKHFDNFYSKYENREGFACMNITGEMLGSLSMTASENGDGKNEKADTLKDISMIKMVVTETNDREFLKDLDNVISKGDYRNI